MDRWATTEHRRRSVLRRCCRRSTPPRDAKSAQTAPRPERPHAVAERMSRHPTSLRQVQPYQRGEEGGIAMDLALSLSFKARSLEVVKSVEEFGYTHAWF